MLSVPLSRISAAYRTVPAFATSKLDQFSGRVLIIVGTTIHQSQATGTPGPVSGERQSGQCAHLRDPVANQRDPNRYSPGDCVLPAVAHQLSHPRTSCQGQWTLRGEIAEA